MADTRKGSVVPPGGIDVAVKQLDLMIQDASSGIKSIPRDGVERQLAQQHFDSLQLAREVIRLHTKK